MLSYAVKFAFICSFIHESTILFFQIYKAVFGPYENWPLFACVSQHLQPKSRGTVRLKSTNPYDSPAIDPNYFENPEDLKVIVEGKWSCQKLEIKADPINIPGCNFLLIIS
ncbi:hypothetical protein AVEN_154345-1 [Araneus ventricosus]|uniref:Glucose-methanol-choline oxidoreductase C-terminal domain-containing protein n=1 Tax=Araneus ventricosus TaxID=182803 RepID=A0A4Y2M835_ARAVE|nr:hypothetical protein AVEN_154345-1 [Araneus ventricosus]